MQRSDVCLPLRQSSWARQCDVGLDKVSHQQCSRGGWLPGESDTAPGLTMSLGGACSAAQCSWTGAGISHNKSTQLSGLVSDFPEDSAGVPARKHLRAPRLDGGSHGRAGCTPSSSEQLFSCTWRIAHAMCLFLALDVKKVPSSLYFCSKLQPAGRRVFFGGCAYDYVARKFFLAGKPRSFDVLRFAREDSTCRCAQQFEWQARVGHCCMCSFGIGGRMSDVVLRWRGAVPPSRVAGSARAALHKVPQCCGRSRGSWRGKARRAARMGEIAPTC